MRVVLVAGAVALAAIVGAYMMPGPRIVDGESDAAPDLEDYGQQAIALADGYTDGYSMDYNQVAFLMALRMGEGTQGQDGYRTLFGGGLFDSFDTHPALAGWRGLPLSDALCAGAGLGPGCVSTAAGAFQFTKPTWVRIASKLRLPDFSPACQDAAAWELIREKGADVDVLAGRTAAAIAKVRKIWASLPGAGYGQHEVAIASFNKVFTQAGGVLA
ncbi:glycoside hydrolase family 104 protein [Duganella sp. BuS-21]|uniref:glycoside hydrolase family 24 protein n=1 Tax=Duganella sp. BuS-21 TaxID=2943848 RepID=UPI0035A58DEF